MCIRDRPDTAYDDGKLALKAIADLKRLKEQGKPFFMACGLDVYKRQQAHQANPVLKCLSISVE